MCLFHLVRGIRLLENARHTYVVREACRDDIPGLESLVDRFVQRNRLLPRTTDELSDLIPFGFVAVDGAVAITTISIYTFSN